MKRLAALAVLATVLATSSMARAVTERLALLVSNNFGGDGLATLRYAGRDAQRMAEVLSSLGGFSPHNVAHLENPAAPDVLRALRELEAKVGHIQHRGDEALVLFYYSGHAKDGILRMGDSRLDMKLLKSLLDASRARVRIALLDSCGAGAITREKGGQLAPPFVIAVDHSLAARGQVIIASSSADEASQESDDIQGSFFTHYVATGLRGAADANSDGRVTLGEAYAYAYSRTVAATASTRSGAQHPTYDYDLSGAGDVILTSFDQGGAVLTFPEDLAGQYYLVDEERQLIVAEIDKVKGETRRLAVKGGAYVIKKRLPDHLLMQRVRVASRGSMVVDETGMERVRFEDDYAKGTPVLEEELQHGTITLSLSLGAGAQAVFDSPASMSADLFPPIGFVSLEARLHNLLRRHLLLSADLGFGTREDTLRLDAGGALGTLEYPIRYSQVQLGTSILYEHALGPVNLAGGGRLATLFMLRSFEAGGPLDNQFYLTMSPGLVGLVGWSPWDWFHVEAMLRAHYLLYTVDQNRSFGYVEGLASAWVDF
ncbi:MAG: caspase family protein [Pseudomonadota bacterium]